MTAVATPGHAPTTRRRDERPADREDGVLVRLAAHDDPYGDPL
ncbi:hypothetical protein [Cellulosimicrobium composti]|nr:hypothetical protein [Cellulosimicrobium composti]